MMGSADYTIRIAVWHTGDLKDPGLARYNGGMKQLGETPGETSYQNEVPAEDPVMADIDRVNGRIARYCPQLGEFLSVRGDAVAQVKLFRQAGRRATYRALGQVQKLADDENNLHDHIFGVETQGFVPLFDLQYAWATGNPLGGPEAIARLPRMFEGWGRQVHAILYLYGFVKDPPDDMEEVCKGIPEHELNDAFFALKRDGERKRMQELLAPRNEE